MQTASTNICEKLCCSQKPSEFKHGTVIGCHLCSKSICEISLLLNIPRSSVSGIRTKWKQLGTTATQPRSGRPRNMTEWGQHMLKRTVHRNRQLSAESIAKDLPTACGLQTSTTTVHRELRGMGFHGRAAASKPYISKCNAKRLIKCCKACHATRAENSTCLTALCQV
ncbi:unnamed protein product [Staurois parvus]|uniref:Transposase Tc1-like domain-containing protein n=1 Tax=Staurois parvus TaxID=386267 RepID=A0ABN9FBE9_9NEOB|nr:unnamed protein product [Staurois parvus]